MNANYIFKNCAIAVFGVFKWPFVLYIKGITRDAQKCTEMHGNAEPVLIPMFKMSKCQVRNTDILRTFLFKFIVLFFYFVPGSSFSKINDVF